MDRKSLYRDLIERTYPGTKVKSIDEERRTFTDAAGMTAPIPMQRAYSTIEVKTIDDEQRSFSGIASTPSVDRMHDVVEPDGASFELPMPFLWQHDSRQPIGWINKVRVTRKGIFIDEGKVAKDPLLPQLDQAWAYIRSKLVRGLSIGFDPVEWSRLEDTGGYRFLKWVWLELSAVTIPANADASIQTIKSFDTPYLLAAYGDPKAGVGKKTIILPGVPGHSKGNTMKSFKEKIAELEASKATMVARMSVLAEKAQGEFSNLEADEAEEYDRIALTDLEAIDLDIKRYKAHEAAVERATAVIPAAGNTQEGGSAARQGRKVAQGDAQMKSNSNLPKGAAFTRYCMALMAGHGETSKAIGYVNMADGWATSTPEVLNVLKSQLDLPKVMERISKTAVDVGSTLTDSNATWGSALVQYQVMASEFVDLLRPATIVGRIQGLRRVPFNVKIPRRTTGASAKWVGQGKGKPAQKNDFDTISMLWNKIALIAVMTEELVRFSTPDAQSLVQQDLIAQIAQFKDQQFIDPTVSASADNPAAVTEGLTPVSGTGSTIAQVLADLAGAWGKFDAAELEPVAPVWIMRPRTARYLSTLINANSLPVFPSITATGGTLQGAPVIVSGSVPFSGGSNSYIILLDANEILLSDDPNVAVDVSREATVEMDDAPTGTATLSLWQNNLVGLRCEQFTNWMRRRDDVGVTYIDPVAY